VRCVIIGSVFSIDGQGTRILGDFLAVFSLDTSLGFAAKRGDTIEFFEGGPEQEHVVKLSVLAK
jgi:hypothetical protein